MRNALPNWPRPLNADLAALSKTGLPAMAMHLVAPALLTNPRGSQFFGSTPMLTGSPSKRDSEIGKIDMSQRLVRPRIHRFIC